MLESEHVACWVVKRRRFGGVGGSDHEWGLDGLEDDRKAGAETAGGRRPEDQVRRPGVWALPGVPRVPPGRLKTRAQQRAG